MVKKIKIEKRRTSFWIYNFEMHKGRDYNSNTSFSLFKSISNVYDFRFKTYRSTLDLYDAKRKILKIPRGYGFDELLQKLINENNHEIVYEVIDNSKKYIPYEEINIKFKENYVPRNEIQKEAIKFLTSCIDNEYVLGKGYQLYLSLDTGMGKTFCTIYALAKLKLPSLIISYNLSDQWKEKILEYTDTKESEIYMIKGIDSINKLFEKKKKYKFYIASTGTLSRFSKRYFNLNILINLMSVGVKVFDEAHSQYKANSHIDVNSDVRFTFYLTATPRRSNYLDNKVYQNLFRHIPIHGVYTHTLNNYYKVKSVKYDTFPTTADRKFCSTIRGFSSVNYYNYLFRSEEKTLLIIGMIKFFCDKILYKFPKSRILVFIPTLDFMNYASQFLIKNYNLPYTIGQYNSNVINQKIREKELEKNVIFTTLSAGSTGKDIPNLKAVLSLTPFSSPVICRQILGRLRQLDNSDSYFIDFTDTGFASGEIQRNLRMRILEERCLKVDTININNNNMILYLQKNLLEKKE